MYVWGWGGVGVGGWGWGGVGGWGGGGGGVGGGGGGGGSLVNLSDDLVRPLTKCQSPNLLLGVEGVFVTCNIRPYLYNSDGAAVVASLHTPASGSRIQLDLFRAQGMGCVGVGVGGGGGGGALCVTICIRPSMADHWLKWISTAPCLMSRQFSAYLDDMQCSGGNCYSVITNRCCVGKFSLLRLSS